MHALSYVVNYYLYCNCNNITFFNMKKLITSSCGNHARYLQPNDIHYDMFQIKSEKIKK